MVWNTASGLAGEAAQSRPPSRRDARCACRSSSLTLSAADRSGPHRGRGSRAIPDAPRARHPAGVDAERITLTVTTLLSRSARERQTADGREPTVPVLPRLSPSLPIVLVSSVRRLRRSLLRARTRADSCRHESEARRNEAAGGTDGMHSERTGRDDVSGEFRGKESRDQNGTSTVR
jgi:hypothetical protein